MKKMKKKQGEMDAMLYGLSQMMSSQSNQSSDQILVGLL